MTTTSRAYAANFHTANYIAGMQAMAQGRWGDSLAILLQEPQDSPAYVLSLGNAAMALGYMERFEEAEAMGQKALAEAKSRGCPHPPSYVQFARKFAEVIKRRGRRVEAVGLLGAACALAYNLIDIDPAWADLTRLEKAHSLQARGAARFVVQQDAGLPSEEAELMMEDFRAANTISQRTPDSEEVGRAECLTNFALALGMNGDRQRAEYALLDAAEIAARTNNQEQFTRIETAAKQLGISSPITQGALSSEQGAVEAANEGRFGTAFIRYCIAAQAAIDCNDISTAARLVATARGLEGHLDPNDLEVPKLRNSAATLAEREGRSTAEIATILAEGAHQWYARLAPSVLRREDFDAIPRSLHDHFRRLARYQLMLGNADEALLAFECGKALSLAVEIDREFLDRVIRANPFSADGRQIKTDLVKEVQASLGEGEVAIALAALPPNLVAFVVRRDSIVTEAVAVGSTMAEAKGIQEALRVLPDRLAVSDGKPSIPDQLIDLASRLRGRIGTDVVRRFVPYAFFHRVPWRPLLRDAGLPWNQLPFTTEFGALLRHASLTGEVVLAAGALALGHGTAGLTNEIDFRDEARIFAEEWGSGGSYREPCSKDNLRAALLSGQVVLLSCHGYIKEDQLYLRLTDGDFAADTCVPDFLSAPVLILSACFSGVYAMAVADNPMGWAPSLLRLGTLRCICARWPVNSRMTKGLFQVLAARLRTSATLEDAFVAALEWAESEGFDFWNQLACLEVIGRN